jgi:hypothetical protein
MNLLELRKFAIDRRVEIRFGDSMTARECLIDSKGQARIPGETKDFRIEEAFDAAEMFQIGGDGGTQTLTREAMEKAVAEAIGRKDSASHDEEEE